MSAGQDIWDATRLREWQEAVGKEMARYQQSDPLGRSPVAAFVPYEGCPVVIIEPHDPTGRPPIDWMAINREFS